MPRRERVISQRVTGETKVSVPVERGASVIQVVLERQPFEQSTQNRDVMCRVEVQFPDGNKGAVEWGGGVAPTVRPGQRMLWSYAYWQMPKGARTVDVVVKPKRDFDCVLHVDFF